ncbi:MAG: hypothetical protein IJP20_02645 [Clostridia bacterium]|nr:hypothetical protein [Clostridia bacterium]
MVKRIAIILLLFCIIDPTTYAFAEEDTLDDNYYDIEDGLPDDIADQLPDGIFSEDEKLRDEALDTLTSWQYVIDTILEIIGMNFRDIGAILGKMLIMICFCSILNAFSKGLGNEGLSGILNLVGSAVTATTVISIVIVPFERSASLFDSITIFVNTVSPLICGMYAMGGNVNSAIVNNYALIVFLSMLENVLIIALESIIGICTALALVSSIIHDQSLNTISNTIKRAFTAFIGFAMLIFTTVVSTQNLLAARADTLSTKAAKMLAANMIPLVGGTVGESLRTAGASIEYLRSGVGIVLLVALLLLVLPTLISICAYRLSFTVAGTIASFLGCEREGRIIGELSSILGYIFAIITITSIALLYLVTVFAKCGSPLN